MNNAILKQLVEVWRTGSIGTLLVMTTSLAKIPSEERSDQRELSFFPPPLRMAGGCVSVLYSSTIVTLEHLPVSVQLSCCVLVCLHENQHHQWENAGSDLKLARGKKQLLLESRFWFKLVEEQNQSCEVSCYQAKYFQIFCYLNELCCITEAGITADFWDEIRGFSIPHNRTKQVQIN